MKIIKSKNLPWELKETKYGFSLFLDGKNNSFLIGKEVIKHYFDKGNLLEIIDNLYMENKKSNSTINFKREIDALYQKEIDKSWENFNIRAEKELELELKDKIINDFLNDNTFNILKVLKNEGSKVLKVLKDFQEIEPERFQLLKDFNKHYKFTLGINWHNVPPKVKLIIQQIFQKFDFKKYNYVLGGGTSLTLLGFIDRYSEDIDLFVEEKNFESFVKDFKDIFKKDFEDKNGNKIFYINNTKIEVVYYDKERISNNTIKNNINFMSINQTFQNKIQAIEQRRAARDLYDLMFLYIEFGEDYFFSEIKRNFLQKERIIKRYSELIKNGDEKLNAVLKHKKTDIKLLEEFFKELKNKFNKRL